MHPEWPCQSIFVFNTMLVHSICISIFRAQFYTTGPGRMDIARNMFIINV